MSITLTVNGETHALDRTLTVSGLLAALNIPAGSVVVERNREILHKDRFAEMTVQDGDEIEIIRFVGGG